MAKRQSRKNRILAAKGFIERLMKHEHDWSQSIH